MRDGLFHFHMKNISRRGKRGEMKSAVTKAAYNSGVNMRVDQEDRLTTLPKRHDVVLRQIFVPAGAPEWAGQRERLWNLVDRCAKRKDARLAKEMTGALVVGIPQEQWGAMVTEFAAAYLALGQVVDIAIHEDGSLKNPHVHFLMTVNTLEAEGFGRKITEVDHKRYLKAARTRWEALTNKYLKANGLNIRVDARSYKARGLSQQPTRHRGPNRAERAAWRHRARENSLLETEKMMTGRDDDPRTWIEHERHELSVDQSSLYGEQWDRSLDVVEQARQEPVTEKEQALRAALKDAPEPVRFEVEKEILHQKAQRLAEREQTERLDFIERNLDADSLREFHSFMEAQERAPDYPQPERGPDDELRSPVELADAKRRMREDYERDR